MDALFLANVLACVQVRQFVVETAVCA
jgi:hypothetical protein